MSDPSDTPGLDLTRAPRGELVASKLVEAVVPQGDLAERHYLELKGPGDLTSKQNKQKVAKFILGAANRMPDKAAEAFEGCAVMIIGITKDSIRGVPPIEMLELTQVVERFTGVPGPKWDIVRVPVKDSINQVLLVVVEPPQMGQEAFICRANGDDLMDGAIYFRAEGQTRQAKSAELDQLKARGAAVDKAAPVELDVAVVGEVVPITVDDSRTLDEYVARTRARLIDSLPKPKPPVEPKVGFGGTGSRSLADLAGIRSALSGLAGVSLAGQLAGLSNEIPEDRSKEEYLAEIDQWEAEFREAWPDIVTEIAGYALDAAELSVLNKTQTYLHGLAMKLHLEGEVTTIDHFERGSVNPRMDIDMPRPPRKWGPIQQDPLRNYMPALSAGLYQPSNFNIRPSSSTWTNTGSVNIDVRVGDLRPEAEFVTGDNGSVLVIYGDAPEEVHGSWRATARGYNEVFKGETTVAVGQPRDLTKGIRIFLRLEDPEGFDDGADEE